MQTFLGIDVGTAFITVFNRNETTVQRFRHHGKIVETLRDILNPLADEDVCVFTGKAGSDAVASMQGIYLDEVVALSCLLSSRQQDPFVGDKGYILDIGASSLTLYTVTQRRVVDIARNTLCAAGTGLFLEEQAERLGIDLERLGVLGITEPPLIASRCSVFAKSDLIHHQQEGRSKDEMWAGLCRSLVVSAVNTLFRGRQLQGKILICGGVSLNAEVMRWFRVLYPRVEWLSLPGVAGEALIASGASMAEGKTKGQLTLEKQEKKRSFELMPPLSLIRSRFPEMVTPKIDSYGLERRIHCLPGKDQLVIMGMDIGSTSTKLALLDSETRKPLLDIYGRTAGDPIGAAKKIFSSLYQIVGTHPLRVAAFGTTGSGRKLVGEIFGADVILNEISAHGAGAAHFFPEVETIFEIGGQDAKYIRMQNGYVTDVNMNYVCAAGTGSFVEEQARKLGFQVQEVGTVTEGIAPPVTSDRCTVFMEQDLRALLKEGFSKEEALASVLYSVIRNYLSRVVGNRKVTGKRIFFQGATARNKGLVAAIENLLNLEVEVSSHCHVMGAIGAALRAQQILTQEGHATYRESGFIGKHALHLEVTARTETCKLCRNFCRINYISRSSNNGGRTKLPEFSWGYQCGRDAAESQKKQSPYYELFTKWEQAFRINNATLAQGPRKRNNGGSPLQEKGVVTIINALTGYSLMPLWQDFFNRLGYKVKVSAGSTDSNVKAHASKLTSGDYCFPVKAAIGHMAKVSEANGKKPDNFVFLPYMIADQPQISSAHSFFCPYVESCASIVKSILTRNGLDTTDMLSPVVDFREKLQRVAETLFNALKGRLDVTKRDVTTAFKHAYREWQTRIHQLEETGNNKLQEWADTGKPVFLIVGRPYNLHDKGVNLGIPAKIAAMGYPVVPIDMLTLETSELSENNYHNIFWKYGQRIMAALASVKLYPNVFPIYFSNFNCGPDSFLLSFAEDELAGRPMLVLELDEHDADGGYMTRIESFLDVVHGYMKENAPTHSSGLPHIYTAKRKAHLEGKVWIPPIHFFGASLYAASFRRYGFDCQPLEPEDQESFVLAKKHLRGGECMPMALTLGAFLKQLDKENSDQRHILFMPTTEGPCRFGQYNLLDRIVFKRLGLENVEILSPSSVNAYDGLSSGLRRQLMHATMMADVLFKMVTRTRPYEHTKGDTDQLFHESLDRMIDVIEKNGDSRQVVRDIADRFKGIAVYRERKPLVGIVGEIYVRCNPFANGNLVEVVEANGGEAWVAPFHEWILYTAHMESFDAKNQHRDILKMGGTFLKNLFIYKIEKSYYEAARVMLHNREEPPIQEVVQAGTEFLPEQFSGEAILTIGRAALFAKNGADMVVNAAPFGCMPGTLSGSILLEVKERFQVPFVSLFYDGGIDTNDKVASILKTIKLDRKFLNHREHGEHGGIL